MRLLKAIQLLTISFLIVNPTLASPKIDDSLWVKSHMKTVSSIRDLESTLDLKELDQIVKDKRVLMLGDPADIQFNGAKINSSSITTQCVSIFFVPVVHATEKFE